MLTRSGTFASLTVLLLCAGPAFAQTTASMTQTVAQRNTVGVVTGPAATGVQAGLNVTFSYTLNTAGAPAPVGETVQASDGSTALGAPEALTNVNASNLLPYSQINTSTGWTTTGTAPTLTLNHANGPDGSSNTSTQVAFPSTTSGSSGVAFAVPGMAYAGQSITLSVWAQTSSSATLTLQLTDSPAVAASGSTPCAVTSIWQRCTFTYTFPSNAGAGFAAALLSSGQPAQSIDLWGVQVEQAGIAGPYVSTIGSARPTGAAGGSSSLISTFHAGTHSVSLLTPAMQTL